MSPAKLEEKPQDVPASDAPQAAAPTDVADSSAPTSRLSRTDRGGASQPRLALAAEVSLLAQAADALAKNDVNGARSALSEHRRRFQRPQLREERDGLSIVVRCLDKDDAARGSALAFMRKSPSSMLAARIKQACRLSDDS